MRDLQCEYSTDVMSDITVRYFSNNPAVWAAITFHLAHMPPSIYAVSSGTNTALLTDFVYCVLTTCPT